MTRRDPKQGSLFGTDPEHPAPVTVPPERAPGQLFLPEAPPMPAPVAPLRPGWEWASPELATRRDATSTAWAIGYSDGRWSWTVYPLNAPPGVKHPLAMTWAHEDYASLTACLLAAEHAQDATI